MPKRGKARWKDPGYPCRDCEDYYNSFTPEERARRVQSSCRHRSEHRPAPRTPPGFWSIDFPSTPEYMASGALIDGDVAENVPRPPPMTARRRRRLKKFNLKFQFDRAKREEREAEEEREKKEKEKEKKNEDDAAELEEPKKKKLN